MAEQRESLTGRDPSRNTADASYAFDYDELDRRMAPAEVEPENAAAEFLVRGILMVKEDIRPQLCIDSIVYGLCHPFYLSKSLQIIADWNGVTKTSVVTRVKEVRLRLGLTDAHIDSLRLVRHGPLFSASHNLVETVLFIGKYSEPKSMIDCTVRAIGHPMSLGVSLDTIAKRYGITKAGIHKQERDVVANLRLPQWRHNKSPEASKRYAQSNTHTAPVGDAPRGPGLSSLSAVPA